ncbi:efflux transporter outer membrane subunit [Parvularcula lutaonensis]|uniref:Efflux transporter outer membrane subunit n=1 Tax=Parvularcula lutaonensis TaxID=491923 RepID=A0ABV7MAZ7_9PROT|nr:efflux transporter outer membrane subunit [Parvularcula lutaonensis]GGY39162.1 multidrug efflux outer membrane protein OprN [Parvularcula lutaonensis]
MQKYLMLVLAMTLSGCIAVGPRYNEPGVEGLQEGYVYGGEDVFAAGEEADANPVWWRAFSDPRIGEMVGLAQAQNRDLRAAFFRLEAAEARAGAARRALLPQGGTSFAITRQQQPRAAFAGFGGAAGQQPQQQGGAPEFTLYQAQAQASWEVDLFGRLRRQAQGASARAEQQAELLRDAQRLTTAQTVDTFLVLVEALNRRRVALDNLALQQRTLALTEQLYELGEIPQLDLFRQQTLVNTTAAQVKQLENAAADATASMALLVGMTVPDFLARFPDLIDKDVAPPIPSAEGAIVLAEPAEVLRKRPDVIAAERQLAAETYDIGVETAGLFPQVSLVGSGGLTALDFSGLGEDNAVGYSVGPQISWQILSYPLLLRQRAAASAEARAALANYEQTVLRALTETDRALAVHSGAVEQAVLLSDAERTATRAAELTAIRYREGADSLLNLLDAQRTALSIQDQAVTAKVAALRTRAAVHRVLAD